jgi:dUTPase
MMLSNITDSLAIIEHGDRLVQCTIEKSLRSQSKLKLTESNEKPEKKLDRDGGFGSTG